MKGFGIRIWTLLGGVENQEKILIYCYMYWITVSYFSSIKRKLFCNVEDVGWGLGGVGWGCRRLYLTPFLVNEAEQGRM